MTRSVQSVHTPSGPLRSAARLVQIGLVLALCLGAASVEATEGKLRDGIRPVVFVHGGSGSGAQFESQALRFASNGYPDSFIRVLEYDSSSIGTILPQVLARLDALIAEIQAETGFQQVDLVGHSLGTVVSQAFLASPLRAANVAHYVNVDGRVAGAPPGGVATLALFAGAAREVQGEIVGATNITLEDQEHVEAVTSPEAFVEMFRFFTGRSPRTSRIVPALLPFFPVSGRAVLFPQNDGVAGSLVLVFEVNPRTGQRKRGLLSRTALPEAIFAIDESGEFGPFRARRGAHYEFALLRDGARPHSFYFEPFLRRDRLVRLNTANEGEGIGRFVPQSDATSAVSISRNKEFRGDRDRDSDRLFIEGTNILNETTAPSGFVGAPVAFFAFDALLDGASNLTVLPPPFALIPFINAVDLVLPADERKTIDIVTVPRGRLLATRRIRVPARPSSEARISVQLNDFER